MKTYVAILFAGAIAFNTYAQGTVVFDTRVGSTITTHVYGPLASGSAHQIGQGTNDRLSGTTNWTGYVPVGAVGGLSASTTFAQLLGAVGYNQPEDSLLPAAGITTFRTGTAAGAVATATATFANIPAGAPQATLEMVAWDNSSGLYSTWALASAAWASGVIAAGKSGAWNQDSIGGLAPAPNLVNAEIPGQQAVSFNLYYIAPEPSTLALVGLGTALLIFRRK